jgi:hypothetical protein
MPPRRGFSIPVAGKSAPTRAKRIHGVVKSVSEHDYGQDAGKYVQLRVAHGRKRKPNKKSDYPMGGDSRAESSIMLPKQHAGAFGVGRKMRIDVSPLDDEDGDE